MAVMDEFKEEREALKRGTPKQKLAYFWYYYKWHVIISVIIIGMLVSFIYQFVNRKDTAFNAVLLNASLLDQMSSEQPDFLTDFAEKEGIALCYGHYSGGYAEYQELVSGARIIRLTEGRRGFTTWIRFANGRTKHRAVFPQER